MDGEDEEELLAEGVMVRLVLAPCVRVGKMMLATGKRPSVSLIIRRQTMVKYYLRWVRFAAL